MIVMTCSRSRQKLVTCTFTFYQSPRGPGLLVGLPSQSRLECYLTVRPREAVELKSSEPKRENERQLRRDQSLTRKKKKKILIHSQVIQEICRRLSRCVNVMLLFFFPSSSSSHMVLKTESFSITSLPLAHYSTCQKLLIEDASKQESLRLFSKKIKKINKSKK